MVEGRQEGRYAGPVGWSIHAALDILDIHAWSSEQILTIQDKEA